MRSPLKLFGTVQPAPAAGTQGALLLGDRAVQYRFLRAHRRTIALRIDQGGLSVSAPLRAPWRDVEAFVREKERWILRKLDAWAAAPAPCVLRGIAGEALPLFGAPVRIELRGGRHGVLREGDRLVLALPEPGQPARVLALLQRWLKERALETLAPRLAHYAARLGRPVPRLALSNARRQWGVCVRRKGGEGLVRLSWRLVHLEPALADYVVAHEAAHLIEMNHSPRFWNVVGTLYPDWRAARKRLRHAGTLLPLLGEPR